MCLLSCLLSVCCIGCGIGKPPVMTLEQWQAEYNSVRFSPGGLTAMQLKNPGFLQETTPLNIIHLLPEGASLKHKAEMAYASI